MKVGFIGGKTSTIGFQALGVQAFPVAKPSDATALWQQINPEEYAIIYMTEPIYQVLAEEVEETRRKDLPVVTVLPAVAGSELVGQKEARALVEKAVGADVMFGQ